jgi:phenylalanyl-tRNA synthetase alpha subunit|tara:strand:- start:585 stop:980 length:396 start_codon:yes stop_codon:yes gene_type:complete
VELLQQYIEEIGKDLVLDDFNLKESQLRLPARKHYWVARLIEAKVERNKLISKKKALKKEVVKQVIRDSPIKITQSSAEAAAENHNSLSKLNDAIRERDMIIEYLEKVEKIMSSMGYEIKNIVEIQKMEQL